MVNEDRQYVVAELKNSFVEWVDENGIKDLRDESKFLNRAEMRIDEIQKELHCDIIEAYGFYNESEIKDDLAEIAGVGTF